MNAMRLSRKMGRLSNSVILVFLFCVLLAAEARAMTLRILSCDPAAKQVVLLSQDTGEEWSAQQGDYVGEWRVSEVGNGHVIFTKLLANQMIGATKVPVPNNAMSRVFELR